MKKFISTILSSVMLLSAQPVLAQQNISTDFWAYKEVTAAYESGWLSSDVAISDATDKEAVVAAFSKVFGKEFSQDDLFSNQDKNITRGELANVLTKFIYKGDVSNKASFSDVESNEFKNAIEKCCSLGILRGYQDGTFKPDKLVTNAELAVIINNLTENNEKAYNEYINYSKKYADVKSITLDMDMQMNMQMDSPEGPANFKMTMNGPVKEVINDLEKFDIELSGDIKTEVKSDLLNQTIDMKMYFAKDTYYIETKDMKVKQKMDFSKVAEQLNISALNSNTFAKEDFVTGYVETLDDGTKNIYNVVNSDMILKSLDNLPADLKSNLMENLKYDFSNMSIKSHIDADNNLLDMSMYFGMDMGVEDVNISADIIANCKVTDINNTVVDKPTDLDSYVDVTDLIGVTEEPFETILPAETDEVLEDTSE